MAVGTVHRNNGEDHLVQFYDDEAVLARNVGQYLAEGLRQGEGLAVIATLAHRKAFTQELDRAGLDPERAVREGRLVFRDAGETLALFMVEGQPDLDLFENSVGSLIRELHTQAGAAGLRAYGEMVDLLWNAGHSSAASRLEHLWNGLLSVHDFKLLCAYQIDVFGKEFQMGVLDDVLRAHTHLVPSSAGGHLDRAVSGAIDEVLGSRAKELKPLIKANFRPSWAAIPETEATVLWLRNNLPDYADEILARAKGHYLASLNSGLGCEVAR